MRVAAMGFTSRYRFVLKHFNPTEIVAFFASEKAALEAASTLDEVIGRVTALRRTLHALPSILAARQALVGGHVASPAETRYLQVALGSLYEDAFHRGRSLVTAYLKPPSSAAVPSSRRARLRHLLTYYLPNLLRESDPKRLLFPSQQELAARLELAEYERKMLDEQVKYLLLLAETDYDIS
jgi:hypothetical protein